MFVGKKVKFLAQICFLAALIILFGSFGVKAESFSGKTIGVFGSPSVDVVSSGVGTNELFFGEVDSEDDSQNRFSFIGNEFLATEEESFKLGEFTYYNGVTNIVNDCSIPLEVTLSINTPQRMEETFIFNFVMEGTPNRTGDPVKDADILTFPKAFATGGLIIGNRRYIISLLGFQQNGNLVNEFVLPENDTVTTELVGKIISHEIVPERNQELPESQVEEGERENSVE